jgi:hypothetical protein
MLPSSDEDAKGVLVFMLAQVFTAGGAFSKPIGIFDVLYA